VAAQPSGDGKPVKYRIYASDEKGFSVSDEPFNVVVGASREVPRARQANFVTEVSATEIAVIGGEVKLTNANRAFYRVVAVDDHGKRSGPSDFAEAPRPILYSRPVADAKVGSAYRYRCPPSARSETSGRACRRPRDDELLGPGGAALRAPARAALAQDLTRAPACSRASRTAPERSRLS